MISLNWLPETAYLYILIFARVGSILMLMPALGEQTIPARMRLSFALIFAAVIYPIVSPTLPPLSDACSATALPVLRRAMSSASRPYGRCWV